MSGDFESISRRGFLAAGLTTIAAAALADDSSFELAELSIDELQAGMKSGKFTARSLAEKYLARIKAIDQAGPTLKSVVELNPDALKIADELDAERKAQTLRGPLHGIPLLIKDNIDTADRMATTAGSLALAGARPKQDAFIVKRLRDAGVVILGKTNLSEWANIRCSTSTSGWSARGGQTKNPYALDRNPSGSSSGSGVAVSSSLCAAAIGTETDGSILSPASVNGIVGVKPTVGLVSRSGIIPISHNQDTAGPMCRSVRDAVMILDAIAGPDPNDSATAANARMNARAYVTNCIPNGLQGARIGVARNYFGFHEAVDAVMVRALEAMKKQGAVLVDPAEIPNIAKVGEFEDTVLLFDLKHDLNVYLAGLGPDAPARTLKDIIEFNEKHKAEEMPFFGQDRFIKAEAKGPLTTPEYVEALAKCRKMARTDGIDAVMDQHKLDALVAPTDGPAWLTDRVTGDHVLASSTTAAAVAGYPSITVPAGFVFGLPVGISFFGRAWSEAVLIRLAYAFEQTTKARKPPQFPASAKV